MSDQNLQDGAAAAATAGGATGGSGECHRQDSSRKTHQRAPGCHGRPLGVCIHGGKLRGPPDENTQPHALHAAPGHPPGLPLEALGCHFRLPASLSPAPQMTG